MRKRITREAFRKDPASVMRLAVHATVDIVDENGKVTTTVSSPQQYNFDFLKLAGQQLSNICYNLSQHEGKVLTKEDCETMRKCVKGWDEELKKSLE